MSRAQIRPAVRWLESGTRGAGRPSARAARAMGCAPVPVPVRPETYACLSEAGAPELTAPVRATLRRVVGRAPGIPALRLAAAALRRAAGRTGVPFAARPPGGAP